MMFARPLSWARVAGAVATMAAATASAQDRPFSACLSQLREAASAHGVRLETFERLTEGVEPDDKVLELLDRQPEFVRPVWDYLAALVDEQRVADGRRTLDEWGDVLRDAERAFGVDRHVLVALWGVETNYGRNLGRRPLVRSLLTVSCFGRRQPFFRKELLAAMRIVEDGHIAPGALQGSWAGAFGHTQFMPSTFQRLAVDFDADGRRDIVGSVPDALASAANYLREAGWRSGEPWGYEVRLPRDYQGPSGRKQRRTLHQWRELGVRRIDGKPFSGEGPAGLLLPAGVQGPAFLVFRNFDALHAYNPSESYALAIAHLSDRLKGAGPIKASWPTDDPALSRSERVELQQALAARGFDPGASDGIIGPRTLEAIKGFQRSVGMTPDGYAGEKLLRALRSSPL